MAADRTGAGSGGGGAGGRLHLTPSATVTVVEHTPEVLVVEARYGEGSGRPPPHLHPTQDERFTMHEGELHVEVGDEWRLLGAGESLEIPRGTAHVLWSTRPARATWETRPAGRTLEWFTAIDALHKRGAEPSEYARLFALYDDVFRLVL